VTRRGWWGRLCAALAAKQSLADQVEAAKGVAADQQRAFDREKVVLLHRIGLHKSEIDHLREQLLSYREALQTHDWRNRAAAAEHKVVATTLQAKEPKT